MRSVLSAIVLLLLLAPLTARGELVGHWGFEAGAGTVAADASGFGNHGSLESSPVWSTGLVGGALHFPGDLDRVVVPAAPSLDLPDELTVSAWIRPREKATQYVVKRGRFDESDGFGLNLSSTGRIFARANQASAGDAYKLLSLSSYPSDGSTWIHAALSFDGETLRLYVNGLLEAALPAPGLAIGGSGEALGIGAQVDGLRAFSGDLDEVRIHDHALSAAEIASLFAADLPPDADGDGVPDALDAFPSDPTEWLDSDGDGSGDNADPDDDADGMPDVWELLFFFDPLDAADAGADADADGVTNLDEYLDGTDPREGFAPGLAGSWRFDEAGGAAASDESGLGNHGALQGSPGWTPGAIGSALLFAGGEDRVLVPHAASLEPTSALTVAAWVRPTRAATQYLVKKGRYDVSDGYEIGLSSSGAVFARLGQASHGNAYKVSSARVYPTDGSTWLHVAARYDGDVLALYLDGALEAELPAPGLALGANGEPLSFGAQSDGAQPLIGALDEVRVYNRALDPAEIAALVAAAGDPGAGPDSDGDGIPDADDPDDDDDGMPDAWELAHYLDPLDPSDAGLDPDGDGVPNLDEYLAGTDPREDLAPAQHVLLSFEEGAGDRAADRSGSGNHGHVSGLPSWVAGPAGTALQLEYAPDLVTLADDPSLDLVEAITLAAWVRPHRKGTQSVISKGRYGVSDGYELGLSTSGRVFARFNQVSAGDAYKIVGTSAYPIDGRSWIHVAVTFDGNAIRLYVDGALDATQAAPGLRIGANDAPLFVGGQDDGTRRLRGAVDEVRVYNHALDAAAIAAARDEGVAPDADWDGVPDGADAFPNDPLEWSDADGDGIGDVADPDDDEDGMPDGWELANGLDPLDPADAAGDPDRDGASNRDEYAAGTNPRDLPRAVGHWTFDEGHGRLAADGSPWHNDGKILGRRWRWTRGLRGAALRLRGRHDRVVVPDHPSLDPGHELTLAAWIRPAKEHRRRTQWIVSKGAPGKVDGYELGLTGSGRVFARLNRASAGNAYLVRSRRGDLRDGKAWRHVAVTLDGTSLRLYVDGVLEATREAPPRGVGANELDLLIGAGANGSHSYRGGLDDVWLLDRALSADELRVLARGVTPDGSPGGALPALESWQPRPLEARHTTRSTGEKPQSKVWRHDGRWWAVFPDPRGTFLWRLDAATWTPVLELSPSTTVQADYALREDDGLVHVLLYSRSEPSELVSAEYVPGHPGHYRLWSQRPGRVPVPVSDLSETATLALDGRGRLWVAYDTWGTVQVRHAEPADHYASFGDFVTVASGISPDDIGAIVAFDDEVGVLWSDANARRFGFRVHRDADPPELWSDDEAPAAASAQPFGLGMADDHLNFAVARDGTLYAAVKTGYDLPGLPVLGLLVRRPSGIWDELHAASDHGTRPLVALNEARGELVFVFTSTYVGGALEYRVADARTLRFGPTRTLLPGTNLNDASTTKQRFTDELVVIGTPDQPVKDIVGVRLAPPAR